MLINSEMKSDVMADSIDILGSIEELYNVIPMHKKLTDLTVNGSIHLDTYVS